MNISVNTASKTNKWAVLAASGLLMTSVVAGCGNKGGGTASSTADNGGSTTPSANFSGSDVVATVNGDNITRGDLYPQMVATTGESALTDLINYNLVMQELKKNNLDVTDAEVDQFLADRKSQDPTQGAQIDQLIKDGGTRLDAVRRRARLQIATEKLVTKDVKADPADVKTWFAKNQSHYGTPARVKVGLLFASTKVRADTMLAQLKAKSKTFDQLLDDQKKMGDPVGANSAQQDVPADKLEKDKSPLGAAARKLGVGEYSAVTPLGKTAYAIITILSKTPAVTPDFDKMKDQATTDYKLEQVARDQVSKAPGGQTFEKTLTQIQTAVAQQAAQQGNASNPSYHDLLSLLAQGKIQEIQTKLRDEAKVTVADPDLKKVADQFKGSGATNATSNDATSNSATSNAAAPAKP